MRFALATLVMIIAACSTGERGNGQVETVTREVAAFDAIEVHGMVELAVNAGIAQRVRVTTDSNLLPRIATRVEGRRLVLETDGSMGAPTKLLVEVDVPALTALNVQGAASATVRGVSSDDLALDVSGAAKVVASGSVRRATVTGSGVAQFELGELLAESMKVNLSGAGQALVNAKDSLDVDISGAGNVTYLGTPKLQQAVSGVGSVKPKG